MNIETMQIVLNSVVAERDTAQQWASKLAEAIGKHLGINIGEHTSHHNPWATAIEALQTETLTATPKK